MGITAGIQEKVNLGDLVIPDRIIEYESAKLYPNGEDPRGLIREPNADSRQRISVWPQRTEWIKNYQNFIPESLKKTGIDIRTEGMLSGNKVVADPEFVEEMLKKYGYKIIALEMEAIGVAEACDTNPNKIPFIVIKSVSDFANPVKNDDLHSFCSRAAADLTIALIIEEII